MVVNCECGDALPEFMVSGPDGCGQRCPNCLRLIDVSKYDREEEHKTVLSSIRYTLRG